MEAQCTCGQLHIECTGEPHRISICHCHNCQQRTGSVFATQARFNRDQVRLSGEPTTYDRAGDSGAKSRFSFCPTCGTTVCWHPLENPDLIYVPVGLFADSSFPAPQVSVYEERKHRWVDVSTIAEHWD